MSPAPTAAAPQNFARSGLSLSRESPVTSVLPKSSTHSQTTSCRSWTPHTLGSDWPTLGSTFGVGREYQERIREMNARSLVASFWLALAAAANSHSNSVGSLLPWALQ